MIALVTQADGSTRGQPLVSFALALLLVGAFALQQNQQVTDRQAEIAVQSEQVLLDFQQYPFVELNPEWTERVGGQALIDEVRELFFQERRSRGRAVIPNSIKRRTQERFDARIAAIDGERQGLPAWQRGVVDSSSARANWFWHAGVHTTVGAFGISLLFLLLLGSAIEDVWGKLRYAGFCAISVVAGAASYVFLHGNLGQPWVGASGLCAALLGAYFVQSIRWPALLLGGLSLPGWLMVLLWCGAEFGLARGIRPDTLEQAPFAAHGVLFAFGFGTALLMRQLGVEEKLRADDERSSELVSNPILEEAMAAHADGRSGDAYELLAPEFAKRNRDPDLALALWTVGNASGRSQDVVPALQVVLAEDLRRKRNQELVGHWQELAPVREHARIQVPLLVRIGEVLLDEGEPHFAIEAFSLAFGSPDPMPPTLALRIVQIVRDLDPGLTRQAAAAALTDPQLDPSTRRDLEALAPDLMSSLEDVTPLEPTTPPVVTPLKAPLAPAGVHEEVARPATPAPNALESLDPAILSTESLSATPEVEDQGSMEQWNDPGLIEDLSAELPDDQDLTTGSEIDYDPTSYGTVSLAEDEADAGSDGQDPGREDGPTAVDLDGDAPGIAAPAPITEPPAEEGIAAAGAARLQKLLSASPLELETDSIKVEVEGRGKTRVPYERIEALAVAAVEGLAERPVLLIDLVLNWMSLADEPLRVIRLRSDRFDPAGLMPGTSSALEGIKALLAHLMEHSQATPLPDAGSVRGEPFRSYPDLATYQREVLMVSGEV